MAQAKREQKIKLWLDGNDILTTRGKTATAHWIRDHLLEKCDYKCSRCGWGERNIFTGKIPLELEHRDGNFLNNSPDNLEILCPNCHSLTPTYKGANKKGRPRTKYYRGT
jgi:5-methylcytosine-specific restriction endonuclease McrA